MSLNQLNQLYRQVILDHGQHPRHFGKLDHASQEVELFNPTCGDAIVLSLKIEDDYIVDLAFSGQGCTISMASASMMCEALLGKTKDQALAMIATFQALVGGPGQADESWEQALGDAALLEGVKAFPARYKCAILAWKALGLGLDQDTSLDEGLIRHNQVQESE